MNSNIIRAAGAILAIAMLAGCESKPGGDDAQGRAGQQPAAAEKPALQEPAQATGRAGSKDVYAPDGLDDATVSIKPVGKARISVIDGYPVRIHEGGTDGDYGEARLKPGEHILHVGNVDVLQGLNLTFASQPGQYYALALTYTVGGELFWTPVIVSGAPNGPVVADKDGLLVGKNQTEAIRLLTAASQPAPPEQAKSDTAPQKAEEEAQAELAATEAEAKAKALFDKGAKAFEDNRPNDALQALDEALMLAPGFDSALALRGVVLLQLKQPKAALESLNEAIRVGQNTRGADDEWLHWPWAEKGLILLAARQPGPAHDALSESIRLKPTVRALAARANLSFAQGQALGKKGDWDGAEPYFRSAQADAAKGIELQPDSVKFWSIKTGTHIMLNEHEQACSSMRRACDLGNCSILEQYPQCKPGGS